jgi:predicted glycosyltransferase
MKNNLKENKTIWFDLATPKFVMFFKEIIKKLEEKKINYYVTTRGDKNYQEPIELLNLYNIKYFVIGNYGGSKLKDKFKARLYREKKLLKLALKLKPSVLFTGSIVEANAVAYALGIKIFNINDMPIKDYSNDYSIAHPVTRLTAPLSTIMFKPFVVPDNIFLNMGLTNKQIINYNFLDPLIWLKDFKIDKKYIKKEIPQIKKSKPIVVIREEEYKASYVLERYTFLDNVISKLQNWDINLIIIPRYESNYLKDKFKKAIILEKKIKIQHLLAQASLFIGGGGTLNIEACYFSVPVISTRSFISHYDKFLIDNNLMWYSNNSKEIISLAKKLINKKTNSKPIFDKMDVDIDMFIREIN